MKTSSSLQLGMIKIILLTFLIFSNISISAQCNGTFTLTTQTEINKFACTSIIGNLIIRDNNDGIDNIVSLDPIFVNGLQSGTVSGSVTVENCNSLTNLQGLDGITSIGDRFTIRNCPQLSHLGSVNFKLQSVGTFFLFINLPNFTNATRFVSVKTVGSALAFQSASAIQDLTPFNTLTSCPWIEFYQTTQLTVNAPFTGLTSTNYIHLFSNAFKSFTGFNNLTSLSGTSGELRITQNSSLNDFNINPGLNSANVLTVTNNTSLADCCFLLSTFSSNPTMNISNNAVGCQNATQVNAPPILSACPSNRTVSTGIGNCVGTTNAVSPIASDNCDLSTYNLSVLSPNGSIQNVNNVPSGVSLTYSNLMQGLTKITYVATDQKGNSTNCSFNVTVQDTEKPVLSNIPPNVTIHCNDNFPTIPSPIINDNCDPNPSLTIASSLSVGNCTLGQPAEIHSYSWTLTDASGNVSTANWVVTVISDFSFDLGAPVDICAASSYIIDVGNIGQTYAWSTGAFTKAISVNLTGTYSVTVTTKNGCCYVDSKMVTFSSPPNATAMGATLNCGAASVQIFGSSSASGVTYTWNGPGGFTSNLQNPMVSNTGTYTLTVSNATGCSSSASAIVSGDNDIPNANAVGGTLDCTITSVQLMGSSTSSGVTYSWTGPSGFTSNMQNPTVSTPGIYNLNVLSGNGCSGSADVVVIDNTIPPNIMLVGGTLNCTKTEIALSVADNAVWTGPDGFSSTNKMIVVSSPGTYAVTVTGSNSCTNSGSVEIMKDVSAPNISATGGVINCVTGQTILSGNSTTPGVTYSWTGPLNFITEIQNPVANIAGTYTLKVTASNGCTSTQDVEVSADMDAPEVSVNDGSIDCVNTSTDLTASSPNENITFMWEGPNGFTAEGENITVSEPGEYIVLAVNENGCAGVASSNVAGNNMPPTVSIFIGPLGCQTNDVTFITQVSDNVSTYAWSGPNSFISDDKEPVITETGTYSLTVTADNGCSAMTTYEVISDSEVPDADATVDGLLTCTQNTITLMGSTTTDTVTFLWTGPDGFISTLLNPVVSQPGVYIFSVIAANGCAGQSSVEVVGDGEFPTVNATGGAINCINSSVVLSGTTNIADASVKWEGPNGFATSVSNPEIEIAGEYTFTVTTAGGCVAFKTVTVSIDNQDPNLSLTQGFLDCDAGVRNFRVVTNADDPTITWTGPNNFESSELNPSYTKAGTYNLLVVGSNGCSSQLSIVVDFDIAYEHTLTIIGNDALLEIEGGTGPFEISWDNNIVASEVADLADGEHFVKIVDGLGCTKFIEFTINTSSVSDLEEALELKIYPNPVIDELKIEWQTTDFEPRHLEIIDAHGKKIQRSEIAGRNSQILNMHDLTAGIYFVKIEGKESVIFKKFLKM